MTDCLWEGPPRCSPFIANHLPRPGGAGFPLRPTHTPHSQGLTIHLEAARPLAFRGCLNSALMLRNLERHFSFVSFVRPPPILPAFLRKNQKVIAILSAMKAKTMEGMGLRLCSVNMALSSGFPDLDHGLCSPGGTCRACAPSNFFWGGGEGQDKVSPSWER